MSEVLGDADPFRDGDDFDSDDYEYDDGFSDEPSAVRQALASVLTPGALALAALGVAVLNRLSPIPSYLVAALTLTHTRDALFQERSVAVAQIAGALLAGTLAAFGARNARSLHEADRRLPRLFAGAALLIAALSLVEGCAGLIILAGAHVPSFGS